TNHNKTDAKVNWNPGSKWTASGRLGWLRHNYVDPPAFGDLGGPPVSSAGGKIGKGYGDVYTMTFSGTYSAKPNLIFDSYFGWTIMNTTQEPPRLDENLGLTFLGIPGTNGPARAYGGWPQFSVDSYGALGNPGSGSAGGPVFYADRQYQYTANASWNKST